MERKVKEERVEKQQTEEEEVEEEVEEEIEEEKENEEEKEKEEEKEIQEKEKKSQNSKSNESKSEKSAKEENLSEEEEPEEGETGKLKIEEEEEIEEEIGVKKNNLELKLRPGLKINIEWFYDERQEKTNILFSTTSNQKIILHWGVYTDDKKDKWYHPDFSCYPMYTVEFDDFACQTEFNYLKESDDEQKIRMIFPKDKGVNTLNFVFWEKDENIWYNNDSKDYHIQFY